MVITDSLTHFSYGITKNPRLSLTMSKRVNENKYIEFLRNR